jgi:hypothetical protein
MRWCKNRPKFSPTFLKINTPLFPWTKVAKILYIFCNYKKQPKENNRSKGGNSTNLVTLYLILRWSPWCRK